MSYDVTAQTGLDIIKRALRLCRAIGQDQAPTDEESNDCMLAFNGLLQSLGNKRLMLYELVEESFAWPAATVSRTIGATGNFATVRPISIHHAFTRDTSGAEDIDTPVRILDREQYDSIEVKATAGSIYPEWLYYDAAFPLGTLYLAYPPSTGVDLHLSSVKPLTQLVGLTTVVAYPPGYYDYFCYTLAIRIAPEFNADIPKSVYDIAAGMRRDIGSINSPSMVARLDETLVGARPMNILSG